MTKEERKGAYDLVTEKVIEALDRGVVPWRRPWEAGFGSPTSLSTGRAYRGVNVFMLAMSQYGCRWWGTYKQIKSLGGQVRKGEHGTVVVFWKVLPKKDEQGEIIDRIFFLRYYKVFNVEQADWPDGLPAKVLKDQEPKETIETVDAVSEMLAAYVGGPTITRGGSRAYYAPGTDTVNVPPTQAFHTPQGEFGTLAHELAHSTGHSSRLNREEIHSPGFGSEPYAREELVAEMAAAFLGALYGVTDDTQVEQSAAYIAGWRKAISEDVKLIVSAAGKAQHAVDRIVGPAETATEDDSVEEAA